MKTVRFALLAAGFVALAGTTTSASAATPVTDAFVANLEANIAFLKQSSHIAAKRTKSTAVRDFARSEAKEQTKTANALGDIAPTSLDGLEKIVTGRSAAIDGAEHKAIPSRQATNGKMPMGQAEIGYMSSLSGQAFDAAYWAKQHDALSQIEADYRSYIKTGDDPALIAMAKAELPKVTRRLEQLGKI